MKFSIVAATLAVGAHAFVATPVERSPPTLVERDLATVTSVLADVKTGFNNLQAAAAAFNGDPGPLKAEAAAVISKVESGTIAVQNMTPLTVNECLSLVGPSNDLAKQGQSLVDELKSRLNDVQTAKECGTVLDFLNTGLTDAKALIAAIKAKSPTAVQSVVQTQGDKITKPLQDGQAAFGPGKCVNAA
ncbi:Cell wall galactomannoprotein [Cordyceps fumosorosea ARSEF 2679]|uniref:Cell wall galactomannoprotein n=1 Tax=Cordyceps fumosorosea (strain ARSEF 2679) TaxID=1081104 RepID=A0A162JR30_CORFA|nr:Cell wall galactomannoprotein [Cordyceps fumosorosea ARSEF 2679]OAA72552.1 Cell wall galactomannoprotein [Cordyceps fumosorosea ARSEF 2679]